MPLPVLTLLTVDMFLKTLACRIYAPSYIGLASALSYYELIPEAVFQITSITTRRNKHITTPVGAFNYRSITPRLFFGITTATFNNETFLISDVEKTLLDYLHFHAGHITSTYIKELRLNNATLKTIINPIKLKDYLTLFASKPLATAIDKIMKEAHVKF
jgi:predicted transcriptional regulator of viral defense system